MAGGAGAKRVSTQTSESARVYSERWRWKEEKKGRKNERRNEREKESEREEGREGAGEGHTIANKPVDGGKERQEGKRTNERKRDEGVAGSTSHCDKDCRWKKTPFAREMLLPPAERDCGRSSLHFFPCSQSQRPPPAMTTLPSPPKSLSLTLS
ncbi:hypothetical protein Dda_2464 [Drechslerella dactyloides]|uniref:Uncharacterized protein n=1 Tax=Drechslerella dactyloides TaxID=74499 RepID=A0AAD6J011_DREDA|nr:hypothetical protein Dda_2464 [Drechslerella dactyloides]